MNPCVAIAIVILALAADGRAVAAAEVPADQPRATLTLPAAVEVDSTGVFLDRLFSSDPPQTIPHIRLAEAPAFGQTASLSRTQLVEVLRVHLPEAALPAAGTPAQVIVARKARLLDEEELRSMLTATLQERWVKDRGELLLRLSRPWTGSAVPDEPLEIRIIDVPAAGLNSSFVVRFEIWSGRERVGQHQLALQAQIWAEVPVARSTAARGLLLRDADVTTERRDLLAMREPLRAELLTDGSLELVETIRPGQPVLARSVRVRPVIRRGGVVEGVLQDGMLSISLKVEVLEDGLPGQTVRLRNPKTKREMLGKVQNEQTVLLVL